MDVKQMRQLIAIHRAGGFVKAAEELGISQPALSRSIARLEDQLRVKLFERSRAGAIATPLALALIARAERLVTESQRLARDMELVAAGQSGEVRIGVGPTLRATLPELALALAKRFPKLRFSLNADTRRPLVQGLTAGKLDLVVISDGPDLKDEDWVCQRIFDYQMIAIARPGHPLASRKSVSLDEFVAHPAISAFKDQVFNALDPRLAATRRRAPPPAFITNDPATVLALVIERGATHIGSEHTVTPWLRAGQVVPINLEWEWRLSMYVATTRPAIHSPVVAGCAALIVEVTREVFAPWLSSPQDEVDGPRPIHSADAWRGEQ